MVKGCNHQGPFSEGPAAEPQDRERNQLFNAGFESGLKHGAKEERAAVIRRLEDMVFVGVGREAEWTRHIVRVISAMPTGIVPAEPKR